MERRLFLISAGTGVLSALAGCEGASNAFSSSDLPTFVNGWAEIQEDTLDTVVVLQFDENIQDRIDNRDISGGDLIPPDEDANIRLELFESAPFERVPIDIPSGIPSEKTARGLLKNYVGKQEAGEGGFPAPWYSTGIVYLSDEMEIADNAEFIVRFPSGYEYRLPSINKFNYRLPSVNKFNSVGPQPNVDITRPYSGLFDYGGQNPDRSIPRINHFDYNPMVALRASAQYRLKLAIELSPLYDWEHEYYSESVDDLISGINEIAAELAQAALEQIITAPLPRGVSGAEAVYSTYDAVTTEFEKFQQAANSTSELILGTANEPWMNFIHDILTELKMNSKAAHDRNVALVTANDGDNFKRHLRAYGTRLTSDEQTITQELNQEYWAIRPQGGEYWESLHGMARDVLQEIRGLVVEEQEAIRELRNEFT